MAVSLTLYISATLLLTLVAWLIREHNKLRFFKRHGIPGPDPVLLLGNLHQLAAEDNPNDVLVSWIAKYGNIFGYYKGTKPYLVINDIDIIKNIMIKEFEKFTNRVDFVVDMEPLNSSLVNSKDAQWKVLRRALTPAFSAAKMRHMLDKMNAQACRMTEVVKHFGEEEFEVGAIVQALTLDVIGNCALAMDVRSQGDPSNYLFVTVREFFESASNPVINLAIIFPPLRSLFTLLNKFTTASKMTNAIIENLKQVIVLRKAEAHKRNDMLQLIMDAVQGKSGMDDRDVVATAHIFLLGGYETTATALTFILYLLAKHPTIQDQLYKEIEQILGGVCDDPTYEDIQAMHFLDQVLQESMRLYPPVTNFITRICQEDVIINGTFIPRGSVVEVPVWHMHHDPEHWPNPLTFDPDRFSLEATTNTRTNFLAFGIGPRNCIGARFAQLEAKVAVVHILQKFRLESSSRNKEPLSLVCPTVLIRPKDGIYLKALSRYC